MLQTLFILSNTQADILGVEKSLKSTHGDCLTLSLTFSSAKTNIRLVISEMTDFDVETTKMMMRKFVQMEKQFKEAAYFAVFGRPQFSQPSPVIQQAKNLSFTSPASTASSAIEAASAIQKQYLALTGIPVSSTPSPDMNSSSKSQEDEPMTPVSPEANENDSLTEVTKDAEKDGNQEESSPKVVNFESMGKIDVVEVSAAQLRRERKFRLQKKYQIMKRGRFWEINELRKEA
uniref:Uncharacterized protein n=1 Tax=Ditylenchus dipsaci TaxID=166011 RepID=A0A915D8T9_9BILA